MGGDEAPCQPQDLLDVIEEETGEPCPRRESYNPDDGVCLELLMLAAAPGLDRIFPLMAARLMEGADEQHQVRLLRRVAAAFGDKRTSEFLPKRLI